MFCMLLSKKATINQVTITSKNVMFPGYNHLVTTNTDDPSLAGAREKVKVSDYQYRWLAGDHDLQIEHF